MDGDRKYKQHGYQDSDRAFSTPRYERGKPNGSPKQPYDVTGPKLPRLVQNVVASRCFNCATTLPPNIDFKGNCPKCQAPLHCCKQCVNFDSSTRFQCLKPIPVRIAVKDQPNECNLFSPRVTVARDVLPNALPPRTAQPVGIMQTPRSATDARAAFDNLFKK